MATMTAQSSMQVLRCMFQRNYRQRLSVPAVEDRKNGESGNGDTENSGKIDGFKSGGAPALRILQKLQHQLPRGMDKFCCDLRTTIVNPDAVPVVAGHADRKPDE
jgi:hypothetical protein